MQRGAYCPNSEMPNAGARSMAGAQGDGRYKDQFWAAGSARAARAAW